MWRVASGVLAFAACSLSAHAQQQRSTDDVARVDAAVRSAFGYLYALPTDTAAAPMGSWVLDSASTTAQPDASGTWRILVTKLTDTGQGLKVKEMTGEPGTSPAQLAAAMAAMQRLESKISKAEADAAIDVVVRVNPREIAMPSVAGSAKRDDLSIPTARMAVRVNGHWVRADDRELDVDHWSPATLVVVFGSIPSPTTPGVHAIAVTAQGNEQMLDGVIKQTRWDALAALLTK